MASDRSGESRTNSLNTNASSNQHDDTITHNELKGWLMKRSKLSRKWKKQWFLLKNTDLFYGKTPESTPKRIPLASAAISESTVDKKQYAFSIKPKNNGRVFYIQADNESVQNDWMQAICFAKAAGRQGDTSEACTIQ